MLPTLLGTQEGLLGKVSGPHFKETRELVEKPVYRDRQGPSSHTVFASFCTVESPNGTKLAFFFFFLTKVFPCLRKINSTDRPALRALAEQIMAGQRLCGPELLGAWLSEGRRPAAWHPPQRKARPPLPLKSSQAPWVTRQTTLPQAAGFLTGFSSKARRPQTPH